MVIGILSSIGWRLMNVHNVGKREVKDLIISDQDIFHYFRKISKITLFKIMKRGKMFFGKDMDFVGEMGIEGNKGQKVLILGNYSLFLFFFLPHNLTKKTFPIFSKIMRGTL